MMTTTLRAPVLAESPVAPSAPELVAPRLQGAPGIAARRRPTHAMFPVHPVAADYVALPSTEAVREALVQALRRGEPLVGLAGEAGTGKTMLATMAVASLRAEIQHVARLSSAPCGTVDILRHLALAFGMPPADPGRQRPARWLLRTFRQRCARGESSLLVLEEAQHLTARAWFELLMWRDRLRRQGLRLQVLAVGLPAMARHLAEPGPGCWLAQPPRVLHLAPLDRWATREFICVSLRRNGRWGEPALDAAVLDVFHRRTGGVLGRIQRLASRCLQTAEIFELAALDAAVVAQQADELGLPECDGSPCENAGAGTRAGVLRTPSAGVSAGSSADPALLGARAASRGSEMAPRAAPAAPRLRSRALPRRSRRGGRGPAAMLAVLAGLVGLAAALGWGSDRRDAHRPSAAGTGAAPVVLAPAAVAGAFTGSRDSPGTAASTLRGAGIVTATTRPR